MGRRREALAVTRRILARIRNRALFSATRLWQRRLADGKAERAEEARRNKIQRRVVAKFRQRALAAAWTRWAEAVLQVVRLRSKGTKAIARWKHAALARKFDVWQQYAAAESRRYYCMAKVVVRIQRQGLAAAFGRWVGQAAEAVAEREREQDREYLKASIVRRIAYKSRAAVSRPPALTRPHLLPRRPPVTHEQMSSYSGPAPLSRARSPSLPPSLLSPPPPPPSLPHPRPVFRAQPAS